MHTGHTWGLTFARKRGCLSTVTGGKKKNMGTSVGILIDLQVESGGNFGLIFSMTNKPRSSENGERGSHNFRTVRKCIPQEV